MNTLIISSWIQNLLHSHDRATEAVFVPMELLDRARAALRAGKLDYSQALIGECGDAAHSSADCLNLLGLIAEARGQWNLARRHWSRAVRLDHECEAARQNLRRYFELFHWGRSRDSVAFGDELNGRSARSEVCS